MQYSYTNTTVARCANVIDAIGRFFLRGKTLLINRNASIKILIIKLDQLGDCFLSTPIFEHLKNVFPNANIDVVCQESSAAVFENNPFVEEIIKFNYPRMYRGKTPAKMKDLFALIRIIRRKKYDLTIDLRGEPFAALLGFLSGAANRIGFEKEEVGGFLYTIPLQYDRSVHESKRYEKIISSLGGSVTEWQPRIYLTDVEKENGKKLIQKEGGSEYIVIHPGAGLSYKIWPKEYFAKIIRRTLDEYAGNIILLGSKEEKEIGDYIANSVHDGRIKNLIGQLSLRGSYFIISQAKTFLGNDSALAHFAGALDIPTLDLMNSVVDEKRWRPLGKNSVVILGREKNHHCTYGRCPYPCPNMQAISTEEVYEKLKSMFGSSG